MARVCVDVASKEENALLFVPIYLLTIHRYCLCCSQKLAVH